MQRTLIPKALTLLLSVFLFVYLEASSAAWLSLLLWVLCLSLLSIPVLNPRSNFYVSTLSRGPEESPGAIALSFDDGPDPRYTPEILKALDEYGASAIFFIVGSQAEKHPELVQEILRRGHLIGNHSQTHGLNFHFQRASFYRREFDAFDKTITSITGKRCRFFRAPQGFRSPVLASALNRRGLRCIAWSARGFDSVRSDAAAILATISKDLGPGALVLLHDGAGFGGREDRRATLEVLPMLMQEVKRRGLSVRRLDHLLGESAYF